jgi:hypothetical protein
MLSQPHKKSDMAHVSKCERNVSGHGGGVFVADLKYYDLLGQVMTRMNLNWIGHPIGSRTGTWPPFKIMVAVTATYLSLFFGAFTPDDNDVPAPGWLVALFHSAAFLFLRYSCTFSLRRSGLADHCVYMGALSQMYSQLIGLRIISYISCILHITIYSYTFIH